MENNSTGIMIVLGIIALALMGGVKGMGIGPTPNANTGNTVQNTQTTEQKTTSIQSQLNDLKQQIQIKEDEATKSRYSGLVTLSYINRSTDPGKEYVAINTSYNATTTIPITGWELKSTNTGNYVRIPKATYLFFTGAINNEDNIFLNAGDTLYLVTGISPNGASFKVNKCMGYLNQFQTFVPYLNTNCPTPRSEDLSSIPKIALNDACLDKIDTLSQCRVYMDSIPRDWSLECTNFIINKINYPSCVNTHIGDKDFYKNEWRAYLKLGSSLWKDRRENVILYDNEGKIVDTLKY